MRTLDDLPRNQVSELLQQLQHEVHEPPPTGHWRVLIDGHGCGWTSPSVARSLGSAALLDTRAQTVQLPSDDAALARIASTMADAGLLKGWRDELLDVCNDNGRVLGRIERAVMRPLGLTTQAVHLHALSEDGLMWIARRATHKNTDPGMWDTLVGGLMAAGESPHEALLRESNEEAGLLPEHLANAKPAGEFTVRRQVPEGYQVERTLVSTCVLPNGFVPVNQDGEVDAIQTATAHEVLQMIAARQFTVEAALSILISFGVTPGMQR